MNVTDLRVVELPARRVCVRRHPGGIDDVDETRRPMYQHMIMHELVAGASMLRFRRGPTDEDAVDVLIGAASGFPGDEVLEVEVLPAGRYAIAEYEGPEDLLTAARRAFADALVEDGYVTAGPIIQVHHMDAIDGITEQQFQVQLA